MRLIAFEVREDESEYFKHYSEVLGCEITCLQENLTLDNIEKTNGYQGVSILGRTMLSQELIDGLKKQGVLACSTRTVGVNHMDIEHAHKTDFKVANSTYPPTGVAEYTIMLMLMSIRHYKQALWRGQVNDYSLKGLLGKELGEMTIGIIGTGQIGSAVIKNLSGFGCRILAYNRHEKEELRPYVVYTDIERVFRESDMISLHVPLTKDSYHMIDEDRLKIMKDGVVLINTARGELMDISTLIQGIESKKIGALALDVIEGEIGLYHEDKRIDIISNKEIAYLRQFPNVIMTQHMAFYTSVAVENMVKRSIEGLLSLIKTGKDINQL